MTFWPEQSSVRSVQLYQSQQSQTFHFANLWSFNCTVFKLGHCIFLACLIYTFLVVGIGVGWKTVIIKLLQFQLQAELSLAKRKLWQVNTWNCEIWLLQTVKIRNLWIWYWERKTLKFRKIEVWNPARFQLQSNPDDKSNFAWGILSCIESAAFETLSLVKQGRGKKEQNIYTGRSDEVKLFRLI